MHMPSFRAAVLGWLENEMLARHKLLRRTAAQKRANRGRRIDIQGERQGSESGRPLTAQRLQRFVNGELLPEFCTDKHVTARGRARAERLGCDSEAAVAQCVADEVAEAARLKRDGTITERTAQRWMRKAGFVWNRHGGSNGSFIDYSDRKDVKEHLARYVLVHVGIEHRAYGGRG